MPNSKNNEFLSLLKQWASDPLLMASKQSKFIGIFVLALVLLNFPLLGIFKRASTVGGIPSIFIYLFVIWLAIILFMRQNVEGKSNNDKKDKN